MSYKEKIKQLELEVVEDEFDLGFPTLKKEEEQLERVRKVKELLEDFKDKTDDLKEFEEELKKHKDKLTPGQVGES